MKRIIAMALLAASVLSFAACGGKFTCDNCGEEKTGKKKTIELMGEKATFCGECYEENKAEIEAAKALAEALGGLDLGDLEDLDF